MPERTSVRLRVTPGFWVTFALLLLAEEGHGLSLLFLLAGLCHELGHLLAARLLKLPVYALTLSAIGAELDISRNCSYGGELLLAAGGPLVNLLLTAICCRMPGETVHLFAGVNLLLACFNLLPVLPLDGGAVLELLSARLLPPRAGWLLPQIVAELTCAGAVGTGLWLAWLGNPSLLILGCWLLFGRRQSRGFG